MTVNEALDKAIEALDQVANETYEGEELDDPDIAQWIQEQYKAKALLETLRIK